jgi:hypothetical protein
MGAWQPAITDVYDERRGAFLVQYPAWLILGLGLAGVVAFAITGFAGQPLVMYLWLCALVIALQASIFRHASMRVRLIATLVVTIVSMVAVAFVTFGKFLPDVVTHPTGTGGSQPGGPSLGQRLENSVWTYTAINFGLLAIFWIDTIRRWVRRAMGYAPTSQVALTPDEERQGAARAAQEMPSLEELISGDLIAGAVLTLALSFILSPELLGNFVKGVHENSCLVALPDVVAHCTPGPGTVTSLTTTSLTFIDRIQALIYFPLGLIILALTAVLSGLGAAGAVNATSAHPAVQRASATGKPGGKSSQAIAEDVTTTVLKTLRSAVDRRIRHLARNLALSLRTVAWPALIVVAIFGLSEVSVDLQRYLASKKSPLDALMIMGPGLAWGVGAAFALAFSAALFVFRWRVADNTLRFLGLIGFVLLLTFWMFSLALAGFNLLLQQVGVVSSDPKHIQPFLPLGLTTYGSLAALIIWGAIALLRRSRRSAADAGADGGDLVGAGMGSSGSADN